MIGFKSRYKTGSGVIIGVRRPFSINDGHYACLQHPDVFPPYEWFELDKGMVKAKYHDDEKVVYFVVNPTWLRWADKKLKNGVIYKVVNGKLSSP